MSESAVAAWMAEQFTVGNLVTLVSLGWAFGVQYRRLQDIEDDVRCIKDQQRSDAVTAAQTYERRDVLAATLQSINQRLGNIEASLHRGGERDGERHR